TLALPPRATAATQGPDLAPKASPRFPPPYRYSPSGILSRNRQNRSPGPSARERSHGTSCAAHLPSHSRTAPLPPHPTLPHPWGEGREGGDDKSRIDERSCQ